MSQVVSQVRAGTVVRATVILASLTVVTTTLITFSNGDVPHNLIVPMVSDTFVDAPASYVARVGIGIVGVAMVVCVLIVKSYLNAFACDGNNDVWRPVTAVHSLIGVVAGFSLTIVAAVNDREDLLVHFMFASVFFIGTWVWQVCVVVQLRAHPRCTSEASVAKKTKCVLITFISLFVFFSLCAVNLERFYEIIAVSEWVTVGAIGTFTWSLGVELDAEFERGSAEGFDSVNDSHDRVNGTLIGESNSNTSGMRLGSFWRGPDPGDELLDVLVLTRTEDGQKGL